jgi:hypothetical protein
MSDMYPLGFPGQIDPGPPQWKQVNVQNNATETCTVTVPGGEQWLVNTIVTVAATDPAVADRILTLFLTDADGNSVAIAPVPNFLAASTNVFHTWGQGMTSTPQLTVAASGIIYSSCGIPTVVMGPDSTYTVAIAFGAGGADVVFGLFATITYWDLTGATTTDTALGPFMLVPGV